MGVGIELLPGRLDGLHTEFGQGTGQLLECQFHTLSECRIASVRVSRLDRSFQVIDDRQEFFQQLKRQFKTVATRKPDASRDRSAEIYLLASGLR